MRRRGRLEEVMRRRADVFFSLEGAVIAGEDPEAVHDMRVASRQLQEVLGLAFADDPRTSEMVRVIRRARRAQSRVRDLDVMSARLLKMGKKADEEVRDLLRFATRELQSRRKRFHKKMVSGLEALNLRNLRTQVEGLQKGDGGGEDGPWVKSGKVLAVARALIEDRTEAFRNAVAVASETALTEEFHRARIAGKRLRYILEASDELGFGHYRRRIARLRRIQQALGVWHDLEVLGEAMSKILARREMVRKRLPLVRAGCDLMERLRMDKQRQLKAFLSLTENSCEADKERP